MISNDRFLSFSFFLDFFAFNMILFLIKANRIVLNYIKHQTLFAM